MRHHDDMRTASSIPSGSNATGGERVLSHQLIAWQGKIQRIRQVVLSNRLQMREIPAHLIV
jgi:hypothetical protein